MTYREALRLALSEELARDDRVFVMGEEVGLFDGSYKVTAGLLEAFGPDRIRDTPISEEGFVGAGVGAAMLGERPVVEIMTINFLLVAMDQVINHAAKVGAMFGGEVRCPLVIRTPNGAGNQLTAQHSQSFDGWFAGTPGLKVVAPASPADAKGLLKAAIRDDDPVLVIENLPIYKQKGEVPLDPDFVTPIGRARIARAGTDLTIVAHSYAVVRALEVAERLEESHGVSIEVVDLRSLRPLDVETVVESVARTSRALCVEEGWASYGVTAELAARIQKACFDELDAPVERVGMAEVPLPYAKGLEHAAMPNEDRIAAAALATRRHLSRTVPAMPLARGHMSRDLLSVEPGLPLTEVAKRMVAKDVGAVLVTEGKQLVGILTERDVLRAVARGIDDEHDGGRLDDARPRDARAGRVDRARRRADDPRRLPPPAGHRERRGRGDALDPRPDAQSCSRTQCRAAPSAKPPPPIGRLLRYEQRCDGSRRVGAGRPGGQGGHSRGEPLARRRGAASARASPRAWRTWARSPSAWRPRCS